MHEVKFDPALKSIQQVTMRVWTWYGVTMVTIRVTVWVYSNYDGLDMAWCDYGVTMM